MFLNTTRRGRCCLVLGNDSNPEQWGQLRPSNINNKPEGLYNAQDYQY